MPCDHTDRKALGEMVGAERLEDLLAAVSLREIAEAWSCYYERRIANGYAAEDDPDWWAVEFWLADTLAFTRESIARDGLVQLVDAVPDNLLAYVGAGPLMNFVQPDEDRISWIEGIAAGSPRFRSALAAVAVWHEEDWVVDRLERAAAASLYRPRPIDT